MPKKSIGTGLAARNTASVFEAMQDALKVYMGLKQQEVENKQKESSLQRQNAGQESLAKYYDAQARKYDADNTRAEDENQRKATLTMLDRYPGRALPSTDRLVTDAERLGMGAAFEDQMTLPAKRLDQSLGQLPQGGADTGGGGPQYFNPAPQAATGMKTIIPTEDSKARIAAANRADQNARNEANIAGRQQVANTQVGAQRDIAAQRIVAKQLSDAAHNALTKLGITNLEAFREQQLQEHIAEFAVRASDMELRDYYRDPTLLFKSLGTALDTAPTAPPKIAPFRPPQVGGAKPAATKPTFAPGSDPGKLFGGKP